MIIRINEDGSVDKVKPPPNPPDPTINNTNAVAGDPNASGDQNTDPNTGADPNSSGGDPNDPNATTGDQSDPNTAEDPNADPNAGGDPTAAPDMEPNGAEKLKQSEQELFKDFTPQQIAIMTKELKYQYKNFHLILLKTLDKLNKISRNTYDEKMLKFITEKMLKLRILVRDSLSDTFDTRTYLENKRELLRLYYIYNNLGKLINTIYESRYKRREAIEKINKTQNSSNIRNTEFPFSYSKGYNMQ